ncbi:hypothetical protein GLP30_18865 [Photobacterium phosphoreum]|uniref:Uncharacterized protein n=2 Tax=Photobacterium TaxID=657 RepID=A0A2N4UNP6_9GAMM|nr:MULTISPECIES: hypothetical protein [Photobacterium]MBY3790647.1 hypothetical protein [Photobacterium carnosum]MCD9465120.1 hypothetical protein [Photobacterium phosphoreum]MCD9476629.1 hypothetical protein [Photobacterium phosphoreum]MCD9481098.1 hypothetical protein [Photobacterium phosphoreum]MCD9485443.1 hypothetical protein [Photobacterium phosphoreum]
MEIIFIDQVFSQIVYGQYEKDLSAMATKQKLQQLDDVFNYINDAYYEAENILGYKEVKRALEQCLLFIEEPLASVTNEDFIIYLSYAKTRLREAEKTIAEELNEFNLEPA